MSELSDETRRALEDETNRGPWDNYADYLDDDWEDYEVVYWDKYMASLTCLDRQWERFTDWWPIVRLSNWWYRLSVKLHLPK